MPGVGPLRRWGHPVEQRTTGGEDRSQRLMTPDWFGNRFEPALDPAVQRVVVAALVMRLMRLAQKAGRRRAVAGKTAAPIAAAIGHVGVDTEIVPARGE